MADKIAELAREYLAQNVASCDCEDEVAALASLVEGLSSHLKDEGWSPADFQVDVEHLARESLKRHCGSSWPGTQTN